GHITVERDGPPCPGNCPNHGCLEAVASGPALGRLALEAAAVAPDSGLGRALAQGREATGALVTELAHDGDPGALGCLERMGRGRRVAYPEHNGAQSAKGLVARIVAGDVVALATDAGMPVVSDPGWVVIAACVEAGLRVDVLPGASSVLVALAQSALPAATWRF